jgi:hypothetical protein
MKVLIAAILVAGLLNAGCSMGTVRETYEVTPSASKAVGPGSQYRYQRQSAPGPFQQQTECVRVEGKLYLYRQAPDGTITLTPLKANP